MIWSIMSRKDAREQLKKSVKSYKHFYLALKTLFIYNTRSSEQMDTKKTLVICCAVIVALSLFILLLQTNTFGKNPVSAFAENSYAQIENFEVKNSGDGIFLSVKPKAGLPSTSEEFDKSKIISFGYAWLAPSQDGSFSGIFANVHTIGGVIGPWHSEFVKLTPKGNDFCLLAWTIVNEVSTSDDVVKVILTEDQLSFPPDAINKAASVVVSEDYYSCQSGFKAQIINTQQKG